MLTFMIHTWFLVQNKKGFDLSSLTRELLNVNRFHVTLLNINIPFHFLFNFGSSFGRRTNCVIAAFHPNFPNFFSSHRMWSALKKKTKEKQKKIINTLVLCCMHCIDAALMNFKSLSATNDSNLVVTHKLIPASIFYVSVCEGWKLVIVPTKQKKNRITERCPGSKKNMNKVWLSLSFVISLQELKAKSFNARKRFQLAIICVRAVVRIKRLHNTPEPLSTFVAREDPYRIKVLRKVFIKASIKGWCWLEYKISISQELLFDSLRLNSPDT